MTALIVGLILFLGIHLVPSQPSVRAKLVERFGEGGYKGLFSLTAAAGLGLIVWGKANADYLHVWQPPLWTRDVVVIAMLPALLLMAAGNMPGNIRRLTPHPMLWAVVIWGLAHLAANGDLASMLLFGSFVAFAAYDIPSANRRGAVKPPVPRSPAWDVTAVVTGLVAYVVLMKWHATLFGVPAVL